jgi:DNA gyrase subunit B
MSSKQKKSYEAEDIQTLEIIEAIRLRPGMYLGSADDDGVAVATREVIDNVVDEHLNGNGDVVLISINEETGVISVEDRARGIPVEEHPQHPGVSTLEAVLTKAHTGGKFGKSYGISGGLHGTGLKAVTATSTHLRATVWRNGLESVLVFNNAKIVAPLASTPLPKSQAKLTGTRIEFVLDKTVFKDATSLVPNRETLRRMLRERAYINAGLTLTLNWAGQPSETFFERDGIAAFAAHLADGKQIFKKPCYFQNPEDSEVRVAVALAWTSGYGRDNVQGFTNSVRQSEGGTHITGLKMAVPQVMRAYVEANGILTGKDKDLKIEAQDFFEGVIALVSIRHKSPVFKGQHKGGLSNTDAQGAVIKAVNTALAQWLEENPKEARSAALRAVGAAKARIAASKAREAVRKNDAGTFGMKNFGKLKDCASKDPTINELFLVEGDSAGGSASMGRNRETQAIYALRGKPLNSWEADANQVMSNNELSDLAAAVGTGLFNDQMTQEEIDELMAKLRYHKIVILADADIDGSHIDCLLNGHFYKHMLPLIERGHIYIGQPPLYRVTERGKHTYLKDETALRAFFRKRAKASIGDDKDLLALAGVATQVRGAFEKAASSVGVTAADISQAFEAVISYDQNREDWLMAFAERLVSIRERDCEAVEAGMLENGAVIMSGLEPSGRFFTTVVNDVFYGAVAETWKTIGELMDDDSFANINHGEPRSIGELVSRDLFQLAKEIERISTKGISIQRIKGLGEMQAEELGETTLDPATRRMVRVRVSDFDSTGAFIRDMLSKSTVPARVEIIRSTHIDSEMVDA